MLVRPLSFTSRNIGQKKYFAPQRKYTHQNQKKLSEIETNDSLAVVSFMSNWSTHSELVQVLTDSIDSRIQLVGSDPVQRKQLTMPLSRISQFAFQGGMLDLSLEYSMKVHRLIEELNDDKDLVLNDGMAEINCQIGMIYEYLGNKMDAQKWYGSGLAFAKKGTGDVVPVAEDQLACFYENMQSYNAAKPHLLNSFSVKPIMEQPWRSPKFACYVHPFHYRQRMAGFTGVDQNLYDLRGEAVDNLRNAKKKFKSISEHLGDKHAALIPVLIEISTYYKILCSHEEAEIALDNALSIEKQRGNNTANEGTLLSLKGILKIDEGNLGEAKKYLDQTESIFTSLFGRDDLHLAFLFINRAFSKQLEKNIPAMLENISQSIKIMEALGIPETNVVSQYLMRHNRGFTEAIVDFNEMVNKTEQNEEPLEVDVGRKKTTPEILMSNIEKNKIYIISKSTCPFCIRTKALLKWKGLPYESIEVNTHPNGPEIFEIAKEMTNQRTVPMIFINKKFIGGDSDLQSLSKSGKLDELAK